LTVGFDCDFEICGEPVAWLCGRADSQEAGCGDTVQVSAPDLAAAVPAAPVRVILAARHARTRVAIRGLLEATGEFLVAAEVASTMQAVQAARREHADVVLFDLGLAGAASSSFAALVSSLHRLPVIALGLDDEPAFALAAVSAGAAAYLLLDADPDAYRRAIRAAGAGLTSRSTGVTGLSALATRGRQREGDLGAGGG
jgi:DNA-binding NarL/FixJ family response regulator